jgi:hypothetical protein
MSSPRKAGHRASTSPAGYHTVTSQLNGRSNQAGDLTPSCRRCLFALTYELYYNALGALLNEVIRTKLVHIHGQRGQIRAGIGKKKRASQDNNF